MDVLHRDLLLDFAAMPIERIEEHGIGAGELVRLRQVLSPPFERYLLAHGAPVAVHCAIVRG